MCVCRKIIKDKKLQEKQFNTIVKEANYYKDASHKGANKSIFVHDHGMHERFDKIFGLSTANGTSKLEMGTETSAGILSQANVLAPQNQSTNNVYNTYNGVPTTAHTATAY